MNACSEYALDGVVEITAIPLSAFNATSVLLSPVIDGPDFSPSLGASTIVVGLRRAVAYGSPVGRLVPIIHDTAKVKDSESDNVAGRAHSISVECDVDDRESSTWETLRILERTPHHLILTLRDTSRVFVLGTEDAYLCTVERGNGKTELTIKLKNFMGMQRIQDTAMSDDSSGIDIVPDVPYDAPEEETIAAYLVFEENNDPASLFSEDSSDSSDSSGSSDSSDSSDSSSPK